MKTEPQEPRPWINSRHQAHVDEEIQTEPDISMEAWDEIFRLQRQADNAMAGCLFLAGIIVMTFMIAYIMFVNGLIVH